MSFGISVYLTEDYSIEGNIEYIKRAKEFGFNKVFTSLHLPEKNYSRSFYEIKKLLEMIKALEMKITADVSPISFKTLGAETDDLSQFKNLGIDCLRVDYGFNINSIALMSRNKYGIGIEINASTFNEVDLEGLYSKGADIMNITASHNYYPRPYTGLSWEFFIKKTIFIKNQNLKVSAFIPSQNQKRGPLYEGLPTIEAHRNIYSDIAAKHLLYSRLVDTVYFGDSYASDDELGTVGNINKDVIELGIVLFNNITQKEMDIILSTEHTNRPDASGYIFRSLESRKYANIGSPIEPNNCISRNAYCLTVDNKKFMRYSGELQICLNELPQDNRVNVVGYIEENSRILTDYIKPGCRVRFKLIKTI